MKRFLAFIVGCVFLLSACGSQEELGPVVDSSLTTVMTAEEVDQVRAAIGDANISVIVAGGSMVEGSTVIIVDPDSSTVTVTSPDLSDMDAQMYEQSYDGSPYEAVMTIVSSFS